MSEIIDGNNGMTVATSCPWCHAMNSISEKVCGACGHDAQKARLECGCERCLRLQGEKPAPEHDVAGRAERTP